MISVTRTVSISLSECDFSFTRSSGPGGQKVNKTSSCAILTWNLQRSRGLTDVQKTQLRNRLGRRLTNDGEIVIRSDRFRDRNRNVADCVEKLRSLLQKALARQKKRIATKPTAASKKKRLESKKMEAEKKRRRAKVSY